MVLRNNGAMAFFEPRPENDTKPYSPLWKAVPAFLFLLFFVYQHAVKAAGEKDTASRQETTFADVLDCKAGGKTGKYCHYVFLDSDERSYVGGDLTSSGAEMGQTVNVYYDSQDPSVNALENFSAKSRDDENWAYIFLLLAAGVLASGFYSKANLPLDQRSP
jgi:hypothetical protein